MTFQHRAGVRPYTSSIELAESCVFVKQSIPHIFCPRIQLKNAKFSHLLTGSLLPKLQEYFAEFLNWSSLTRLRILSSPTCVGFRYESTQNSLRSFSCASRVYGFRGSYASRIPFSGITVQRIYLSDTPTRLHRYNR